ncbi:MAG: hypothetical protein K0S64_809 [Gaiellaceae bacterium]|jgi:hypothetical protein|nr:hypothetical protein [Gaiellaceae bacterium]
MTRQMLAEAKARRIEVTVSTRPPKATGDIVLLPDVRPPTASS